MTFLFLLIFERSELMQSKQEHDECQGLIKFNIQCYIQCHSIYLKAFEPQAAGKKSLFRAIAFMCSVFMAKVLDQKYALALLLTLAMG